MSIKQHIPNSLTLLNLLCGTLAIAFVLFGRMEIVFLLLAISLIADFLDGLVARALKVSSPIGAELDSLADMVSFGVVPGFMVFGLMTFISSTSGFSADMFNIQSSISATTTPNLIAGMFGFMITLFSALRLAKFNVSTDQTDEFKGLATPAATLLVVGLWLIRIFNGFTLPWWAMILVTILICTLLVSNLPMFSFKLKGFSWKDASWQYVFIILSILSLIIFKFAGVAIIVFLYIALNILRYFVKK